MLSLVERGRAPPSIGSLTVIANSLGITMSDLMASDEARQDKLVVHFSDVPIVETAKHVVRRLLRDDRERGISIALNEYALRQEVRNSRFHTADSNMASFSRANCRSRQLYLTHAQG